MNRTYYDLIGIGVGPFNLGLAALAENIPGFKTIFFEKTVLFNWHPGLMLKDAQLQVPFYADLVTVVDPTSPFTFLNYLKEKKALFRFAINEDHFVTRKQFNDYCTWVINKLSNLHFGCEVTSIYYIEEQELYEVTVFYQQDKMERKFFAKHLALGIGTTPYLPPFIKETYPLIIHSSNYLNHKDSLIQKQKISIVGSGQSAAEIFYDLLEETSCSVNWYTGSSYFFPMDYSKFALEMTSTDYIEYFYSLESSVKEQMLANQNTLYKGINFSLIHDIYGCLYSKWLHDDHNLPVLYPASRLVGCKTNDKGNLALEFYHEQQRKNFFEETEALILATGYKQAIPSFIDPIKDKIAWTDKNQYAVNRNYSIDNNDTIFVQNAELQTHGFSAPDLGMGPYRNATILNTILKKEIFQLEKNVCFQQFGIPANKI